MFAGSQEENEICRPLRGLPKRRKEQEDRAGHVDIGPLIYTNCHKRRARRSMKVKGGKGITKFS